MLHFRKILLKWKSIVKNEYEINDFTVEQFLSTEKDKLQWFTEGLSSDTLSIQNAIILLHTKVYPLVIDPSSESVKWFLERMKNRTIERTTQNSTKFFTTLELSLRFGKVLIIEEVNTIIPELYSVIREEFSLQGKRKLISINGKLVDFHDNFMLIFVTRDVNLNLPSAIKSRLNVIRFVTAEGGLAEQLLSAIIQKVRPDLETRKKELLHQREELQEKLVQVQDQLLEDLADSKGDILQNKDLIESLNKTKSGSDSITKSLEEALKVQEILLSECNVYKDISVFGSFLYFSAADFSKTNVFYTISIRSFIKLFLGALPPFENNGYDFNLAKNTLIQSFYKFFSRGIFKNDRLTFSLFLLQKIFPDKIPDDQWNVFLKTSVSKELDFEEIPHWIPKNLSQSVVLLQLLPNVYKQLNLTNQNVWENFMKNHDCENHFPQHLKLSHFEKVLVVQFLRPDKLFTTLTNFVCKLTGLRSLHPEILQFSKLFKESSSNEPILIITSSGNDPSSELKSLAEITVGISNFTEISIGENEEEKLLTIITETAKTSHWLILKNLHLVTSWLPILCQIFQNIESHEDFRLWLITEYHEKFSAVLAQNCLKVVFETPQGIKNNILRSFSKWGPNYISQLNPTQARIFFILSCIHALLQERRTYIPEGWSKFYEFSDSDLSTIVHLAEEIWKSKTIDLVWSYLRGLSIDAVYGGRIENIEDLKIFEAYLRKYLNDESLSHKWRPLGLRSPLPSSSNYDEYLKAINLFSNYDLPEYFGLPNNINKTLEKNSSSTVITRLKDIYVSKSLYLENINFNLNEWQKSVMPYMSLWKKLNQGHNFIREILDNIFYDRDDPLLSYVMEEYKTGIFLIQKIHKSFASLNSILKGNSLPSDDDHSIVNDLKKQTTPFCWMKIWRGPEETSDYLKTVIRKVKKINDWRNIQSDMKLLTTPIDLSYTFRPQGFLAAFKQYYARKVNIPIDELQMRSSFSPTPRQNSLILTGILIEGALFNGHKLMNCEDNAESFSGSPDCQIFWETEKKIDYDYEYLNIPLYTSKREKILTYLQVPCDTKEKDVWLTAAVAFLLNFNFNTN